MATFTACRGKCELVAPARPTPKGTKSLSDIDDHPGHRLYIRIVEFFQRRDINGHKPEDPARAIKAALAEVLVYYYPVAGRIRETDDGTLAVDCTGEGIAFVEADAAVALEELGTPLVPPYPCVDELFSDAGVTHEVFDKPLVFVQVTRFRCGGFAVGVQFCHCISDGHGMVQFMKAMADVARGESAPAVLPVWGREQLKARSPPRPDYVQEKLISLVRDLNCASPLPANMAWRYFIFGPDEVSALRRHVPGDLGASCTRFELLTAAIWRCRTAAWGLPAGKRARLAFLENARRRWKPVFPAGYYGNALVYHVVDLAAGELCESPLGRVVELIREAKKDASEEHLRSTIDFVACFRGLTVAGGEVYDEEAYIVSDWTRLGEDELDLGWAQRVAGGVAMPLSLVSFNTTCTDADGAEAVVASMFLPEAVMDKFEKEIAALVKN